MKPFECTSTSFTEINCNDIHSSVDCNRAAADESDGLVNRSSAPTFSNSSGMWEQMYERLLKFRAKHGHCRVPNRFDEDTQLGAWVSTQRQHYKLLNSGRRKKTALTPEREALLTKIGFEWSVMRPQWETQFIAMLEFVTINGHAQVPTKWKENLQLSNWVSNQRREYQNLQTGRPSTLNHRQIELLNSIGFVWQAQRGGTKRHHSGDLVCIPDGQEAVMTSQKHRVTAKKLLQSFKKGSPSAVTAAKEALWNPVSSSVEIKSPASSPISIARKSPPLATYQDFSNSHLQGELSIMSRQNAPKAATHQQLLSLPLGFDVALRNQLFLQAASSQIATPQLVKSARMPPQHNTFHNALGLQQSANLYPGLDSEGLRAFLSLSAQQRVANDNFFSGLLSGTKRRKLS